MLRPLWLRRIPLWRLVRAQSAGLRREPPIGRHTLCFSHKMKAKDLGLLERIPPSPCYNP